MIHKIKLPLVLAMVSVILFYLANTGSIIGKSANFFFPCEQEPGNSMPCFGIWDVYTMVFMIAAFIFSLLWILIVLVRERQH